jgi:hypothetical protein
MEDELKSLNFTSKALDVIVFESGRSKFENEWVYLFRTEALPAVKCVPPSARAVLLDLLVFGNTSSEGLVCLPLNALTGRRISRPSLFKAISALEQFNLVRRANGLIYVSPRLVYRGTVRRWQLALQTWTTFLTGGTDGKR